MQSPLHLPCAHAWTHALVFRITCTSPVKVAGAMKFAVVTRTTTHLTALLVWYGTTFSNAVIMSLPPVTQVVLGIAVRMRRTATVVTRTAQRKILPKKRTVKNTAMKVQAVRVEAEVRARRRAGAVAVRAKARVSTEAEIIVTVAAVNPKAKVNTRARIVVVPETTVTTLAASHVKVKESEARNPKAGEATMGIQETIGTVKSIFRNCEPSLKLRRV